MPSFSLTSGWSERYCSSSYGWVHIDRGGVALVSTYVMRKRQDRQIDIDKGLTRTQKGCLETGSNSLIQPNGSGCSSGFVADMVVVGSTDAYGGLYTAMRSQPWDGPEGGGRPTNRDK